jgi:hypothetical protein
MLRILVVYSVNLDRAAEKDGGGCQKNIIIRIRMRIRIMLRDNNKPCKKVMKRRRTVVRLQNQYGDCWGSSSLCYVYVMYNS